MTSIFDPEVSKDIYLEHMRRTLEWIGEEIEKHQSFLAGPELW